MINLIKLVLPLVLICFFSINPAWSESINKVKPVGIDEFKQVISDPDKKIAVVFTASWCGPCKKELPSLIKLNRKYKEKGLLMIGLSLDYGGISAMQPVVDKYKVDFPVYWGGEPAMTAFNISSIPLLYLINNGKIIEEINGNRSYDFLKTRIINLLEQ